MQKWEYTVHYLPVDTRFTEHLPYSLWEKKIDSTEQPQWDIIIEKGDEGWELISVQPVLKGEIIYDLTSGRQSGGFSMVVGYYFFFKRPKP